MSKDEYPSICARQMEAIMSITIYLFIVFKTHSFLKFQQYYSDIPQPKFGLGNTYSRDAFRPVARDRKYLMDYK